MIKRFLGLVLLLSSSLALNAQEQQSKVFFGGNFGITVGDYLDISIAPLVGYRLTPQFSAGVLAKYEYVRDKNVIPPYDANTYGGGVFARYDISSIFMKQQPSTYNIFLQTEYQYLYTTLDWTTQSYDDSYHENRWYFGAGFSVPTGARGSFYTYLAFDIVSLFNDKNSKEPMISVGYMF